MSIGSEKKQRKKYRIPLVAALCIVFLIVVMVMYSITTESMVTYYYEDDADIELVSVTPAATNGISQDVTIVLEWNHPVNPELADAVRMRPSARGEWFVSGNYLMFTPRQLAAGTYYTVMIPQGTVLTKDGAELDETLFFSFETEDPDLRLPKVDAFDVDGRGFRFSENEDVAIPVNIVGEESTVDVSVYQADSSKDFINAFAELFSYPSWAVLSIAGYEADDHGFDKISDSKMSVRSRDGMSYVDLGSLSEGQYLVRISSGKNAYDVPVTVSSVSMGVVHEDHTLAVWGHKDGEPYANGEVSFNGESYALDENGFASLPCTLTFNGIRREPEALALTLQGESGEIVHFLTADDLDENYHCDLVVNRKNLVPGEDLLVSGDLFSENGLAVNGVGTLRLESSVETVLEKKVKVENGFFTTEWEDLSLADGKYHLIFHYGDKDIATSLLFVGASQEHELLLSVEKNKDTVKNGETVQYVAKVTDKMGKPVSDAIVSMDGDAGVAVNEKGQAVFRKSYSLGNGLYSVQKNASFHVSSDYGDAEDVVASVSVGYGSRGNSQGSAPESVTVQKNILSLTFDDHSFLPATEDMVPAVNFTYYNNDYGIEIPGEPVQVAVPENIETAFGENITFVSDVSGSRRLVSVALCKGRIPDALCGKTLTDETFHQHNHGVLEEQRVFFPGEEINAAFSTVNRSGDYYIRQAVTSVNGNVYVNYVPVSVEGTEVVCPENLSFSSGYAVALPFYVTSDGSFDYILSIGDEVYEGTAEGDFTVYAHISATGQYHGTMHIYRDEALVAVKDFDFEIYHRTPMFTEVVSGNSDNAVYSCQVKEDMEDTFRKAYEIMALPGDQILQRMGRTLFYHALGDVVGGDHSDLNYDLSSLQNEDGSFGRYNGAAGDLLLSVFVAEQEEFICDRDSLCAYLKYRLKTADSLETAALACWGLSCYGLDCSESMAMIHESRNKNDRILLYLAEGYEAAGDYATAEKMYQQLKKELTEENGMLHMPESDDQYNIANTAFMLDLSLKLNREESAGLLEFLIHSDIQIQSGRYLLISAIVRMVEQDDIAPFTKDHLQNGYVPLSVTVKDLGDVPALSTSFVKNDEAVSSVRIGETVDLVLQWEATENSIYLVYVAETNGVSIVEKDGLVCKKGYGEYVTNTGTAKVTFTSSVTGDHVAPKVYILDLTTDRVIGQSEESGWKVTK